MNQDAANGLTWSALAHPLDTLTDKLGAILETEVRADPFQRDPQFVRQIEPLVRAVNAYFATEVRGWERVPKQGPFLVVGNHSGGAGTTDFAFFLGKWLEDRGAEAPLYGLAYDLLFAAPGISVLLRRLGIVPANHGSAGEALRRKAAVVVFPGGDYEVYRPWSERNLIEFGGHKGFIQLAIATGVPVVPMTIHGAHQSTIALTRGRRIARFMGINRIHVGIFPLVWNIPFGLMPALVPSLQLPAKVTVQIGKPLDWSRFGRKRAADPKVLDRCYRQITNIMQQTLDTLAAEHPHPILSRLDELRPSFTLRR